MKLYSVLFLLISFLFSGIIFGQVPMNAKGKFITKKLKEAHYNRENINAELVVEYDIFPRNGKHYIGALAVVDEDAMDEGLLEELEIINNTRIENLWTFRVPINNFEAFIHLPGLEYVQIGASVEPHLDEAIVSSRADSVHQGLGGLDTPYHGKDVIIGVIDWGFDYTHPVFYDSTMSELRLSRAWDQIRLGGTPPAGYDFGAEYIGTDELLEWEQDTLYIYGPFSHGTHVAGIAGGAGAGTEFMGAAPASELVFVSLRRDAASLVDAFNYISEYADSQGKPFVINMSFGGIQGPHGGECLENLAIDLLQGSGKIFVGSAGNNGNVDFHIDRDFQENSDTLISVVQYASVQGMFGQTLAMWGSVNSSFQTSIALVNNQNDVVYQTPFYDTDNEPQIDDEIEIDGDSLHIRLMSSNAAYLNERPFINVEIRNTTPHRVIFLLTSEESHVHVWNNVKLLNGRQTNWGMPLTDQFPGAVAGDRDYGITGPPADNPNVLTVGSYRAEYHAPNGQIYLGDISAFSSKGPTISGLTKPEISSTGSLVTSAQNSFDNTMTPVETVNFNGKDYPFTEMSGTSMSGPMVAGIVALMLEAAPNLHANQAIEIIKATARLDNRTGEIGSEGSNDWGWGKANALAAVLATQAVVDVPETRVVQHFFSVYPNPTADMLTVEIDGQHDFGAEIQVKVYDLSGRMVMEEHGAFGSGEIQLNVAGLENGTYLIAVQGDSKTTFRKFVVSK